MNMPVHAPLEKFQRLGDLLGIELYVQRDDLLAFPLAGNKVRKVRAELRTLSFTPELLITNGAINSNHCRTVALAAAELGISTHLVLHDSSKCDQTNSPALRLFRNIGARTTVVPPDCIASEISAIRERARDSGIRAHVIPGGGHSPAGALAYREAGLEVFRRLRPDVVFVASGTGATHGGLAAAATHLPSPPRVIGVSVARSADIGVAQVQQAAAWCGAASAAVDFDDRFRAGGYGMEDDATHEAVHLGWSNGLPLDSTYTGKAFAALIHYAQSKQLQNARVLFWHTGGLWNYLVADTQAGHR